MAKMKVVVHRKAVRELMCDHSLLEGKAEAVRDACIADSTWGGYAASPVTDDGTRARSRVWSFDDRNDEARDNRMVKNLDAAG